MLGVFGDPAVTGNPVGDDLRDRLARFLSSGTPSHGDLDFVRGLMVDSGALHEVERRTARLGDCAVARLEDLDVDPDAREALTRLVRSAVTRDA